MALIERDRRETVVLVGVAIPPVSVTEAESSLEELAALADTAGADEAERVLQRRSEPDAATFVGKGKAEELRDISNQVDADTVIFDDELSPAQSRNLEKILGRTAIDRTALILDIFAQHAHTPAGKAQVELAQLRYRLPRLRGRGIALRQQPHQLVQAFRSTLEEVAEADLLLHVVDASAPDPRAQMDAVRTVLREIGADDVPELIVFNKADLVSGDSADAARRLVQGHAGSVLVSAATGEGIDRLLAAIGDRLRQMTHVVELVVPYDRGDVVAAVHRQGEVVSECHDPEGTRLWARIRPDDLGRFSEFVA